MSFTERVITELGELVARYAAGDAEVVTTYFSRPRTRADDIRWLRIQAGRELSAYLRAVAALRAQTERLDTVPRDDVETLIRTTYEEYRHYRLLAEILEELTGAPSSTADLIQYAVERPHPDLPEKNRSLETDQRLRREYGEVGRAAMSFAEGGGAGIFIAGSRITGGPLEERIAQAMRVIAEDELRHGPIHLPEAATRIQTEKDLAAARYVVETRGRGHLRLRNETFGYPLDEARLQAIERGEIAPLAIDFGAISPVSPYSLR